MKILHCSDIHLGRRPVGGIGEYSDKRYNDYFKAFDWAINTAIEQKVAIVAITGDLFDRKELVPEVLSKTEQILKKLPENNIKTILIEGNHDNITPGKESDSWIIYLENKGYLTRPTYSLEADNYHFNPLQIDDLNIYGIGYPGYMVNETLTALAEHLQDKKDQKNIVLVHTAISGSDILPGTVLKETIDKLKGLVQYIGGGHFHSYQYYPREDPYFFIPGSLEYWDLAEQGLKGVIIFDTQSKTHQFISSPTRKKQITGIQIRSIRRDDFELEFREIANNLQINRDEDIIILNLELSSPFYIDVNWCETVLYEKGALKAIINLNNKKQKNFLTENDSITSVKTIEEEIIKSWDFFSGHENKIIAVLDRLKQLQKEENQDLFIDTYDKLLDSIIESEEKKNADR